MIVNLNNYTQELLSKTEKLQCELRIEKAVLDNKYNHDFSILE